MNDLALILTASAAFAAGALIGPAIRLADIASGGVVHVILRRRLRRAARGAVVLTYDDGPGIDLQPRLLRVLAETGTRATFYVCGMRTSVLPDAIAAILAAGHELGDHGFAHLDASAVNAGALRRDDHQSQTSLRETGATAPTYRPPYGRLTLRAWWRQRRRHRPIVLWTHDAGDLRQGHVEPIAFAEQIARDGGGVVLMHSHDRRDQRGHEHVLAVTRAIVAVAAREGLPIVTAGEFMGRSRRSATAAMNELPPVPASDGGSVAAYLRDIVTDGPVPPDGDDERCGGRPRVGHETPSGR
jgi:peptidoglycan/xylan/chitin deacetylase (PgdA/CDA1 family)